MRERSRPSLSLPKKVVFNMVSHLVPGPEFRFRQMGAYLLYYSRHRVEPQSGKEVASGREWHGDGACYGKLHRPIVQQKVCYLYLRTGNASGVDTLRWRAIAADLVADSPDGPDKGAVITGIHFAAEVVDVHVDHIGRGLEIDLPNLLDDRCAGDGLALVAHEELEETEFLGAQIDGVTSPLDGVGDTIDFQIGNLEHGAAGA